MQNNNKIISFDFDGTLLLYVVDDKTGIIEQGSNPITIALIKKLKNEGHTVYIVTRRFAENEGRFNWGLWPKDKGYASTVKGFVEKHKLPIDKIFFTNGELKANTLKSLNVSIHYDDDHDEINAAKQLGIDAKSIDCEGNILEENIKLEKPVSDGIGETKYLAIFANGDRLGHIQYVVEFQRGNDGNYYSFASINNAWIDDEKNRGKGYYRDAIAQLAERFEGGVGSELFQTSKDNIRALKSCPNYYFATVGYHKNRDFVFVANSKIGKIFS